MVQNFTKTKKVEFDKGFSNNISIWEILIIEDNPADYDLISFYLDNPKYSINIATSIQDGIHHIEENAVDLILLDLNLPDSYGLDTFERLYSRYPLIPVVVLTGNQNIALGQVTVANGAQDFLVKSDITPLILEKALSYAISRKQYIIDLQRLNMELESKVKIRTSELEYQNQELKSNMRYAKHIQTALSSKERLIKENFSDYFIFNRPKQIIGGDFYWFSKSEDTVIIAVADCTGHGVSGAMMSMLGFTILEQIINGAMIQEPESILKRLNAALNEILYSKQNDVNISDGMDISICSINLKTRELKFSGANHPLIIFKDSSSSMLKGCRKILGGNLNPNIAFETHTIQLNPSDRIYMFSDGYRDQFGGDEKNKLMRSNFTSLLNEIQSKSMEEQKKYLERFLVKWMREEPQVDDILVLGITV